MSKIVYDYVEDYIQGVLPKEDPLLGALRKRAEEDHVPLVDREVAEFLKFLVASIKPPRILELGTGLAYSAINMALAWEGSRIDSVEVYEKRAKEAKEIIGQAGLAERVRVHIADAQDFLDEAGGAYDLIFIDAAKGHYEAYIEGALDVLAPGGLIICDNVLFHGMVSSDDLVIRRKRTIVQRMRRLLPRALDSEEIMSCLLPVADGLLLVRRRDD